MKSTGIVRRIDELGRIVIPIELRNTLGITEKDPVEIYTDGTSIILKRCESSCFICGNTKKLVTYKDFLVCNKCIKKLSELNE